MIESKYLIAVICFTICAGWPISAKTICEKNYDYVGIYETRLFAMFPTISIIAFLVSLIINWVNVGFLSSLCYLGISVGVGLVNGFIISPLLVMIFRYEGLGAIIPILANIASIVWLFIAQFS
ncbi:MAG: hypothetical protein J6T48_10285 [Bacteroidales bacterium]|nr:hypothetical protein [Bacteroidales bacterium]